MANERTVLRPYQKRVKSDVFRTWDAGYNSQLISMATGAGKGHPLDTEIPTPKGLCRFGDLVVGDRVFGANGAATEVTGVFDRGMLPTYRVKFSDHTWVDVDGDHLWNVRRRTSGCPWQTISTSDLMSTNMRDGSSWRWRIPMAEPVQHPVAELPVPPYTLGAYIANGHGHRATTPVLTTPDLGVIAAIEAEGTVVSRQKRDPKYCPQFLLVGMRKTIVALGLDVLSRDKFIPRQYLESGLGQRLSLFRALMDADGGSRAGGRRSVTYHTTSPRLASDVQELVWSLGGTASLSTQIRPNRDKPGVYQDIKIMILTPAWLYPFESVRKFQDQLPRRTFVPTRAIMSVEPVSTRQIRCIAVAAPDHLYQVTRAHIVTHNSVVFGQTGIEHLDSHRADGPVVLLAHRKELIHQAAQHFRRAAAQLGSRKMNIETVIGSPGVEGSNKYLQAQYRWKGADVLVTSPQTLNSARTMRIFPNPSLIICDEAHHYSSEMFKRVLTGLGGFSGTRMLGVTATPFREDHRQLDEIFPILSASVDIEWLINHRLDPDDHDKEVKCEPGDGFLVPPRLRHLLIDGLDLSEVPVSKISGVVDFREAQLAEAMEDAGAFEIVAKAVVSELPDGRGVIFAPTVKSSQHLAEIMSDLGAPCGHLDGQMDGKARDKVISAFRAGDIRWMSNVNIVSEGFDVPEIDTVVLARPTRSRIFFRQAIGRALRTAPGKRFATVFDVAGASDGHSLVGIDALTDSDVLAAQAGESLTELIDRSNRERRGIVDRIVAHQSGVKDKQDTGERGIEQIKLTAENFADQLPGLSTFVARAEPLLTDLVSTCNECVELPATEAMTLDELGQVERRAANYLVAAQKRIAPIEALKATLREALLALREDPGGAVEKALITGYVATVGGNLFMAEEERADVSAPGVVQSLKIRKGGKEEKPRFTRREGWVIRVGQAEYGSFYAPVHDGGNIAALAVAVCLDLTAGPEALVYVPVAWDVRIQNIEPIETQQRLGEVVRLNRQDAYEMVVGFAAHHTSNTSFLSSAAPWRKKPASTSARSVASRLSNVRIPEKADAGYVADLILTSKYDRTVRQLAAHVAQKVGAVVVQ